MGMTPFKAMLGREARLQVDLILPTPSKSYESVNSYAEEMVKRFTEIYQYMRSTQNAVYRRNAKFYTSNNKSFKIEDRVWYLCPRQVAGKPTKITDTWLGPYVITQRKKKCCLP